jgi:hypothetical protein
MSDWQKFRLGAGLVGLVVVGIARLAGSSSPSYDSYGSYGSGYGTDIGGGSGLGLTDDQLAGLEGLDDDQLAEAILRIAREQGAAAESTRLVRANAGYDRWDGLSVDSEGYKAIAVDVELEISPSANFDFDDIDVIVAGENLGSDPLFQRLTDEGEPAGWSDPIFDGSDRYRVLLGYVVPEGATEVTLSYWGSVLTDAPIALDDTSPPAYHRSPEVTVKVADGPRSVAGRDVYVLEATAIDMPRTDPLFAYDVQCGEGGSPDWVAVDENGELAGPALEQPFYPTTRRFFGRLSCPAGTPPTREDEAIERARARIPAATRDAL